MGLVEEFSNHTGEEVRRRPVLKRWMVIAGLLLVLLVGGLVIWQVSVPRDIESVAQADPQAYVLDGYEMANGGQIDAAFSEEEDVGYMEFEDVPELDDGATYQVWLMPTGTGAPSSLGNFTAEELQSDNVEVQGLAQYRALMITEEQIRGQERPGGDTVAEFLLRMPDEANA